MNILIIGYYYKHNWGDDLFMYVIKNYILKDDDKYNITFINIADLNIKENIELYKNIDKVIIGGGDVINNYFLNDDNIDLFQIYFNKKPIYFLSIGLTYYSMTKVLDIGDYYFMRNETDYNHICKRYEDKYCFNIPDIGYNLLQYNDLISYKPEGNVEIKNIGICIPYTWISENVNNMFFDQICEFINQLSINYKLHLIPFDTSNNKDNSDIIFNKLIKERLGINSNINYIIPEDEISVDEMINYFKSMDLIFASRFHSVVLSIITKKPFISIYSTSKINNLKIDLIKENKELTKLFIKLDLDDKNIPIKVNTKVLYESINYIRTNYNKIIESLYDISLKIHEKVIESNKNIINIIDSKEILFAHRLSPPQYVTKTTKENLTLTTIKNVLKKIFTGFIPVSLLNLFLKNGRFMSILPRANSYERYKALIAQEILFTITGDPEGPYYYGLYDNILNKNCIEQIEWIINDYYEKFYYKNMVDESRITLINKNFQLLHRSGWQYVVDNIILNINNNVEKYKDKNNLIIDTYIDKTFNWMSYFYLNKNVIPYKENWIGFIHHTFSDYNNEYNCKTLFSNKLFLESLKYCKCLIVLSEYLLKQIKENIIITDYPNIPVISIYHPTSITDLHFKWSNFKKNSDKQLIQVGNWMRNVFSIYRIELPKNSIINTKSILKNKNSDNYFPPNDFLMSLYSHFNNYPVDNNLPICRNAFKNMHLKGIYDMIEEMELSVRELSYVNNSDYDILLSENIVFLNIVDSSAINTLIECIIRCTPIIVNPLPSIIEMLGESYPLYYNNYYEISNILENESLIFNAYIYLLNLDKSFLHIDNFTNQLNNIIETYI